MSENFNLKKMKVVTDSLNEIIKRYDKGQALTVHFIKKLMQKHARKHNLGGIPKLVDIVSALPHNYKAKL